MRALVRVGSVCAVVVLFGGCGTGGAPAGASTPTGATTAREPGAVPPRDEQSDAVDPAARARAGEWTGASLQPPPHYCNDEGGTEWCDGERDDDCDGGVDEGCADCVMQACVRYAISVEEMRGASYVGTGECVGPVYCGRVDGYASTEPPGGCGAFHCGTLVYDNGTARPHHCTIWGRCASGEFSAEGFSW